MEEKTKLPIYTTIIETYSALLQNWMAIIVISILPSGFIIGLSFLQFELLATFISKVISDPSIPIWVIQLTNLIFDDVFLLVYCLLIPFLTTICYFSRYVLDVPNCFFIWRWTENDFKILKLAFIYIILTFVFFMLSIIPTFFGISTYFQVNNYILVPAVIILTIASIYLFLRLSLLLPAAVFDIDLKFKDVWKLSKSNVLCMFWITFFGMLPIFIFTFFIIIPLILYTVTQLHHTDDPIELVRQLMYYNIPIGSLLSWVQIIIFLNLLSMIYTRLNNKKAAQL